MITSGNATSLNKLSSDTNSCDESSDDWTDMSDDEEIFLVDCFFEEGARVRDKAKDFRMCTLHSSQMLSSGAGRHVRPVLGFWSTLVPLIATIGLLFHPCKKRHLLVPELARFLRGQKNFDRLGLRSQQRNDCSAASANATASSAAAARRPDGVRSL